MPDRVDVLGHLLYQLRNAKVNRWPFPHFCAENVFPPDFYWNLVEKLRKKDDFKATAGRYAGRTFAGIEDFPELGFMQTADFLKNIAAIFAPEMNKRFDGKKGSIFGETRLVRDQIHYQIGPHTDAAWKVVSLLFYLPDSGWNRDAGTSLYLPKNRDFRCTGGPHHDFADFDRIHTAPYIPNVCFGFFKTDNSFHGVEPIDKELRRDVLLFNIYDQEIYLETHKPAEKVPE